MFHAIRCPLCVLRATPPASPDNSNTITKVAFQASDLCAEHLEASGIPQFETTHPLVEGEYRCTHTCGCISLAELDRRLAEHAD